MRGFGVGAAKTGTHSLAAMLHPGFRSAHEPDTTAMLDAVLARQAGTLSENEFRDRVSGLLEDSGLEISVSQINGYIIDALVELYPRALYILTVRDARSWLGSLINHQVTRPLPPGSPWAAFRDLRFDMARHPSGPHDAPLTELGLYGLDAYLAYWAAHPLKVMDAAPADRLLVLSTDGLADAVTRLAEALQAPEHLISTEGAHSFAGKYVDSPLRRLDARYLDDGIDAYTARLREGALTHIGSDALTRLDSVFTTAEPAAVGLN